MDIHDFPSPASSPSVQSEGEGKQGRDRSAQNGVGAAARAGDGCGLTGAITAIRHAAAGEKSPAAVDSCACPLCGGALRETGFNFVDRFIVYGENYCVLTKSQALVFRLLFDARPNVAPTERLYNALCAARPYTKEYPDPSVLRVFLMNIRKKLAEIESPYRIRTSSGGGYALVYTPEASK